MPLDTRFPEYLAPTKYIAPGGGMSGAGSSLLSYMSNKRQQDAKEAEQAQLMPLEQQIRQMQLQREQIQLNSAQQELQNSNLDLAELNRISKEMGELENVSDKISVLQGFVPRSERGMRIQGMAMGSRRTVPALVAKITLTLGWLPATTL